MDSSNVNVESSPKKRSIVWSYFKDDDKKTNSAHNVKLKVVKNEFLTVEAQQTCGVISILFIARSTIT